MPLLLSEAAETNSPPALVETFVIRELDPVIRFCPAQKILLVRRVLTGVPITGFARTLREDKHTSNAEIQMTFPRPIFYTNTMLFFKINHIFQALYDIIV